MLKIKKENVNNLLEKLSGITLSKEDQNLVTRCKEGEISVKEALCLKQLIDGHRNRGRQIPWFHELMSNSSLRFEDKPMAKEVSKELIERRKYLAIRAEERAYNKMVANVPKNTRKVESLHQELTDIKQQLGTGINVMWVTLSAFAIGFFISKTKYKDETHITVSNPSSF